MSKKECILYIIFVSLFFVGLLVYASGEAKCPKDMILVQDTCIDIYEAPNKKGSFPLVMYSLLESENWCREKEKRLCYDYEWEEACMSRRKLLWAYGDKYKKGTCNDSKIWRKYSKKAHALWPDEASSRYVDSLEEQFAITEKYSEQSAKDIRHLYQADPSGSNEGCSSLGVYDLLGNVEEWVVKTKKRRKNFSGALKGRFWSEPRNCKQSVTNHGDSFRFYETGFRCCKDPFWR